MGGFCKNVSGGSISNRNGECRVRSNEHKRDFSGFQTNARIVWKLFRITLTARFIASLSKSVPCPVSSFLGRGAASILHGLGCEIDVTGSDCS